jgi:universal stress protein F
MDAREGMKSILVAVDDAPSAELVLRAGVDMARKTGAKVRLLRVIGVPTEVTPVEWGGATESLVEQRVAAAKSDLSRLAAGVPEDVLEAVTAQIGVAWDAICTQARDHACDLIVIGLPGHGLLERLVGTTAAKVVNHADCAVLVVPGNAAQRPRDADAA